MSTSYSKSDPTLLKLDIENELSCPVCTNTYYNPITLLCQHTFCYHCISDDKIKECPICRIKKFIPKYASTKVTDNVLNKVLKLYYGEDSINELKVEVEDYLEDKRMGPKIEKDMEKKLLDSLNKLAIVQSNPLKLCDAFYSAELSYPISQPYHNPYSKYISYLKYVILILLSFIFGWIAGKLISEVVEVIRGAPISNLFYVTLRLCGISNVLYQFINNFY